VTLVYLASVTTLVTMLTNSFYVALHLSFIAQEIRDLHLYLDDWPHLSNYYRLTVVVVSYIVHTSGVS
jgi:hypothetical protein